MHTLSSLFSSHRNMPSKFVSRISRETDDDDDDDDVAYEMCDHEKEETVVELLTKKRLYSSSF